MQFKQALRLEAKYIVILGEDEYQRGVASIKNTKTEIQEEVKLEDIVKYLMEKLEN